MYALKIHKDATDDLKAIMATNRKAGFRLAKLLQQLQVDQDSLERLSSDGFGGSPARPRPGKAWFNVSAWGAAQRKKMNLWRLRFFDDDALGYRLIYAYLPSANQYHLLGILEKAEFGNETDERFNYELNHPLSARISRAYHQLED